MGILLVPGYAFDSLDRAILLRKLQHWGVKQRSLKWFLNYFCSRLQHVSYNKCCSPLMPVKFRVPQGSILGLILVLFFINDIIPSDDDTNLFLFSGDTTVFLHNWCQKRSLLVLTGRCLTSKPGSIKTICPWIYKKRNVMYFIISSDVDWHLILF